MIFKVLLPTKVDLHKICSKIDLHFVGENVKGRNKVIQNVIHAEKSQDVTFPSLFECQKLQFQEMSENNI